MNFAISLENCKTYIDCQLQRRDLKTIKPGHWPKHPVVTISRQAGAGGVVVGEKLAAYLQQHSPSKSCPWTVFDKNLVNKVLEDHRISQRMAEFMPEDKRSAIQDAIEELLGLHPASWTLVEKVSQTILNLAELGRAIIVGRGANVVIGKAENAFHVRLIGSVEQRQRTLQAYYKMSAAEALRYLRHTDRGRRRYLKRHFGEDIDDPLLYHLVLNTDWIDADEAAVLVGAEVLRRAKLDA